MSGPRGSFNAANHPVPCRGSPCPPPIRVLVPRHRQVTPEPLANFPQNDSDGCRCGSDHTPRRHHRVPNVASESRSHIILPSPATGGSARRRAGTTVRTLRRRRRHGLLRVSLRVLPLPPDNVMKTINRMDNVTPPAKLETESSQPESPQPSPTPIRFPRIVPFKHFLFVGFCHFEHSPAMRRISSANRFMVFGIIRERICWSASVQSLTANFAASIASADGRHAASRSVRS